MKSLNYLIDHILITYSRLLFVYIYIYIYIYKHGEKTDNPSLRIYVNKTENRILFKIKTGYYLDLLTPEMMKLFGSTKSEITKDENGENEPPLEIT